MTLLFRNCHLTTKKPAKSTTKRPACPLFLVNYFALSVFYEIQTRDIHRLIYNSSCDLQESEDGLDVPSVDLLKVFDVGRDTACGVLLLLLFGT